MLTDKEQEEIRQKLLGLEEDSPADGWKKISTQIQPDNKPFPYWWLFAALLLLLTTGGIFYFTQQKKEKDLTELAAGTTKQEKIHSAPEKGTENLLQDPGNPTPAPAPTLEPVLPEPGATGAAGAPVTPVPVAAGSNDAFKQSGKGNATVTAGELKNSNSVGKGLGLTNKTNKDIAPEKVAKVTFAPFVRKELMQEQVIGESRAEDKAANEPPADVLLAVTPILKVSNAFELPDTISLAQATKIDSTKPSIAAAEQEKSGKNWFVGVNVASRYAFRAFTPAVADEIYITKLNSRKNFDTKRLGYEVGFNVAKEIKSDLYLETSVAFMQFREDVSYSYTTGKVDSLLKTTTSDGSILMKPVYITGERQLKSSFTYGGLRVGLTYFFLEGPKSRFNMTVAGGMNLLVKGQTQEYLNGDYVWTLAFPSKENLLEQMNYNLLIGAGYNMKLLDKYELMVMPSLNYFLGSTYNKRSIWY